MKTMKELYEKQITSVKSTDDKFNKNHGFNTTNEESIEKEDIVLYALLTDSNNEDIQELIELKEEDFNSYEQDTRISQSSIFPCIKKINK